MANLYKKNQKRIVLSKEKCLESLFLYRNDISTAYNEAINNYNRELSHTIPEARTRFDSVLLHAKMVESFILHFPNNYRKGKYGRIIFRFDGVQLLIKKLNRNNRPSNVKTKLTDAILGQLQLSLFENESGVEEPIIFFGYSKDKYGFISNPRIIYYDNGLQWQIDENDFMLPQPTGISDFGEIDLSFKMQNNKQSL